MATIWLNPLRTGVRVGLLLAAMALLMWVPLLSGTGGEAQAQVTVTDRPMPEFTHQNPKLWVNTKPLMKDDLKGNVILLEVWTSI